MVHIFLKKSLLATDFITLIIQVINIEQEH